MLYPFMTLNDGTEIVHSELLSTDGKEYVKVCIERPIEGGFQSAVCYLPDHSWQDIQGFSQDDISSFQELLKSLAHIIIQLSKEGGLEGGSDSKQGAALSQIFDIPLLDRSNIIVDQMTP